MLQENVLVSFLRKFDEHPFNVVINGKKYQIGEGEPVFTVTFHKEIPLSALTTSTSIALGEAYMNKDLEIEGNLYFALDHFLGQMGKFSTNETALKKIMHSSTAKKIRMWHLYLSACAATFHNGIIDLHQILFTNGVNNDLPIVRWY